LVNKVALLIDVSINSNKVVASFIVSIKRIVEIILLRSEERYWLLHMSLFVELLVFIHQQIIQEKVSDFTILFNYCQS
jgi:hypothetical protein